TGVRPLPWQCSQGVLTILPLPPQRVQGCWLCITPKGVRVCRTTYPRPPQSGQVSGLVPLAAPVPPQSGQVSCRVNVMGLVQPCTASIERGTTLTCWSAPLRGALALVVRWPPPQPAAPPKMSPKMSPRSPPPNPPPNPAPPAPAPLLGSTPAKPNWSYLAFL